MSSVVIVLMGVSGAGKTTVGQRLAPLLGWAFHDADDYHLPEARDRLSEGERLSEADRAPWITRLAELIAEETAAGRSLVLACSALSLNSRVRLREAALGGARVLFVFLQIDMATAARRVEQRLGHFAPVELVPHQFADLEMPADALVLDATRTPDELAQIIQRTVVPKELGTR